MIRTTGAFRKVDELGRIVLPQEVRAALGIENSDCLEVLVEEEKGQILLQKPGIRCISCGGEKDLHEIKNGYRICGACIKNLAETLG